MYNTGSGHIPEDAPQNRHFYGDVDVADRITATSVNFIYGVSP